MPRKRATRMGSFVAYAGRAWTVGDHWDPSRPFVVGRRALKRTALDRIKVQIVRLERAARTDGEAGVRLMQETRLLRKLRDNYPPGRELATVRAWRAGLVRQAEDFARRAPAADSACWITDSEGKRWRLDDNLWAAFDAVEAFLRTL